MKSEFVVIDGDGNVSYGMVNKTDSEPETFGTLAKAERRAKELAEFEPGKIVKIFEIVSESVAPIGAVKTTRRT